MRALVFTLLIYMVPQTWAARNDFEHNTDLQQDTRLPSSITELIPDLESLDCTTKCDGEPACAQFKDLNSCLGDGSQLRCFWSCE